MRTGFYAIALVAVILSTAASAQEPAAEDSSSAVLDYGAFDLDRWVYDAKRVAVGWSMQFENANEMVQTRGYGIAAYPKDLKFRDGVIECDMAGGAYLGISFRIIEVDGERISEDIYFRVQGNQRAGTVQYYPHGQLKQEELHRPPYEQPIRTIEQDEWFHVRIEVQGKQARVFLDNGEEPVQVIDDLMHEHMELSLIHI